MILYGAVLISKYISNYYLENQKMVNNYVMQQLLYLIQANYLLEKGKPCFWDEILVAGFGVYVERVFKEHQWRGSTGIFTHYKIGRDSIKKEDREYLDELLDEYSKYTFTDLWKYVNSQVEEMVKDVKKNQIVVTNEMILEHYNGNK